MKKSQQSKIKDNPTYSDLSKTAYRMKVIISIISILIKLGIIKDQKTIQNNEEMKKLLEKTRKIIGIPDKFNDYFAPLGWIAYESINTELMETCVSLAEEKKISEAEAILVDYFNESNIKTHLIWLKAIDAFQPREELIQKAFEDYLSGRYYASIPIVLMTIDGLVNDVAPDQKGFFADNPDVTAWDSIAGHSSGLRKLAELFGTTRKKTTTEEIRIPYRNGIMHGRDINYANKIVAAKAWSALFAVGNWANIVESRGKNEPKEKEKKKTLKEIFKQIQNNEIQKKQISKWRPRELIVNKNFPQSGMINDYEDGSPEQALVTYIDFMKKKNYGEMANRIANLRSFSQNRKAGELKTKFRTVEIQNFSIKEIRDDAPAISEIVFMLDYLIGSQAYSKEVIARMIYQDDNNDPLVRGSAGGSWKILEKGFNSIAY